MIAPKLRNRAMQDLAKGYAMDLAAKELRLDHECQTYDNSNPLIQKRADEIMKDLELRNVVIKVSEGKTVEEIRKLHNPAELGGQYFPGFGLSEGKGPGMIREALCRCGRGGCTSKK